jgi:hypothetical protein
MRRALAAAAALAMVMVLAGCSGDPHPVPLTRAQRVALYERDSQDGWDQLAQLSPSTPRPDLSVKTVSTGGQWALDMASCLREHGITQFSVTANGSIDLSQSPGFTSGITGLPQFVCQAQHPNTLALDYYLSTSQLGVLYDYYVGFLEPCLVMHSGGKVGHIPSRARFIATYDTDGWSPYYDRRLNQVQVDSEGKYVPTALAKACPPRPSWLT